MLVHTIAAVILEIAYLATGLILCFIGKGLLEKGITGGFAGEGQIATNKFRIFTTSPGLVFLVAGLAIFVAAVLTPSRYAEGPVTAGQESASLADLAKTVKTSVLAQSSPEAQFALGEYEKASHFAAQGDTTSAVAYLVRAIVLRPELLPRALSSEDLGQVVSNPVFAAIVRERFKLPLELAAASEPADHPILGHLSLYIITRSLAGLEDKDVTRQLSEMPHQSREEAEEVTLERLRFLVTENPRALRDLLRDWRFYWILRNDVLVDSTRARIDECMSQMASTGVQSGMHQER